MGKLTIAKIRALKEPGWYGDGETLYVCVAAGGSKSFVQRVTIDGMRRDIGLGGWPGRSIPEARQKAFENRKIARDGGDPRLGRPGTPTFRQAAEVRHRELMPSWRNKKHADSWLQTLERHAYPLLADMPVDKIRPSHVVAVLKPIWNVRPETARRVRQRIKTVLSSCEVHEFVDRNVAGDCIDGALQKQRGKKGHYRMLPYADLPQFVRDLQSGPGSLSNKSCLLFTILTATRGIEARGALWDEIDLEDRMWRLPGERMKMTEDHDQPLSEPALEVLDQARAYDNGSGFIFVSRTSRGGSMLSNVAAMNLVKRLGYGDRATAHGFRATFRTWATERTDASQRVKKLCTAHKVGDDIEEAYDRAQVPDERRELMEQWGRYVMGRPFLPSVLIRLRR